MSVATRRALCVVGDFFNLGDAFLAEVEARYLLDDVGVDHVVLVTYAPAPPEFADHFAQFGIELRSLIDDRAWFLRACASSDLIVGGGNTIRDTLIWDWLRPVLAGALAARATSHGVTIVGAGAEPIRGLPKRAAWRAIILACQRVALRDRRSAAALADLGRPVRTRLSVTNDVAFLAEPQARAPATGRRRCVVSPAVDPGQGVRVGADRLLRMIGTLHERGLLDEVCVVAHDVRPELDGEFVATLTERIVSELGIPARVADGPLGTRLIDAYASADIVVTGRLHGLILGALFSTPVAYLGEVATKLAPFAEQFGYPVFGLDAPDEAVERRRVADALAGLARDDLAAALRTARAEAVANFPAAVSPPPPLG